VRPSLALFCCMALLPPLFAGRLEAGQRAPAFALKGIDGKEVRYAPGPGDRDSPTLVIVFVDPLQELSRRSMKDLRTLLDDDAEIGAHVRAIAVAGGKLEAETIASFSESVPATGPLRGVLDPDRKAYRLFGVIALPTTFVIDPGGRIRLVLPGHSAAYAVRLAAGIRTAAGMKEKAPVAEKRTPEAKEALRLRRMAAEFVRHGRLAEGREALMKACALVPRDPAPLVLLGELELETEDAEAAESSFSKALALAPKLRSARRGHLEALALAGDPADAAQALRAELRKPPVDPALYYYLGRALERTGDPLGAAAAYRKAFERLRRAAR